VEQKMRFKAISFAFLRTISFYRRTLNWEDTHIMQQQFLLMAKCFLGMEADYAFDFSKHALTI
jgi:hypothetical protein